MISNSAPLICKASQICGSVRAELCFALQLLIHQSRHLVVDRVEGGCDCGDGLHKVFHVVVLVVVLVKLVATVPPSTAPECSRSFRMTPIHQ